MCTEGKTERRSKKMWFEVKEDDIRMAGVFEKDAKDRNNSKVRTGVADPK